MKDIKETTDLAFFVCDRIFRTIVWPKQCSIMLTLALTCIKQHSYSIVNLSHFYSGVCFTAVVQKVFFGAFCVDDFLNLTNKCLNYWSEENC